MLTTAQLQTLNAAILADPVLAAYPLNSDGYYDLAQRLNTELAVPDFYVWRESVTQAEIQLNGFDWVRVDNLSVGKARIWEWMFNVGASINPAKTNVRAGIEETWKGTAADLAVRDVVYGHCRALATRAQQLFAVASSVPPTVSGNLGAVTNVATAVVASITSADVQQARSLP